MFLDINDKLVVPGLLQALQDKDFNVRANAAYACGRIGDKSLIVNLQKIFDSDENPLVKIATAYSLVVLNAPDKDSKFNFIVKHLNSEDRNLFYGVVKILVEIGDKSAIPPLKKFIHKELRITAPTFGLWVHKTIVSIATSPTAPMTTGGLMWVHKIITCGVLPTMVLTFGRWDKKIAALTAILV